MLTPLTTKCTINTTTTTTQSSKIITFLPQSTACYHINTLCTSLKAQILVCVCVCVCKVLWCITNFNSSRSIAVISRVMWLTSVQMTESVWSGGGAIMLATTHTHTCAYLHMCCCLCRISNACCFNLKHLCMLLPAANNFHWIHFSLCNAYFYSATHSCHICLTNFHYACYL